MTGSLQLCKRSYVVSHLGRRYIIGTSKLVWVAFYGVKLTHKTVFYNICDLGTNNKILYFSIAFLVSVTLMYCFTKVLLESIVLLYLYLVFFFLPKFISEQKAALILKVQSPASLNFYQVTWLVLPVPSQVLSRLLCFQKIMKSFQKDKQCSPRRNEMCI